MGEEGDQHFEFDLGERFSEADAAAPVEGDVAVHVALFAVRGQAQWVSVVEALGDELGRSLPLGWIMVDRLDVDNEYVVLLQVVLFFIAEHHIFLHEVELAQGGGGTVAHSLLHQHRGVLQVLGGLEGDHFV